MNFREIVEASGYDPAKATGKVPLEVLREAAKLAMESGEPIAVTERKFRAKRRAMLEDFGRALEHTMYFIDLGGCHGVENLAVLREKVEAEEEESLYMRMPPKATRRVTLNVIRQGKAKPQP